MLPDGQREAGHSALSADGGPQTRGRTWDADWTHQGGTKPSKSAAVDAVDAVDLINSSQG
jgi:hypothetical protein